MTTIATTEAATQAGVTIPTIRTWCRKNVIGAVKRAGRWVIDTASLAARIAIGAMRARKQATVTTGSVTGSIVVMPNGAYGVRGVAADLAAAFEAGTTVASTSGPCAGDRVYLGRTREICGDHGRTLETLGEAFTHGDEALYYLDLSRLGDAPALAAALAQEQDRQDAEEAAMARRDDEYLNPRYM